MSIIQLLADAHTIESLHLTCYIVIVIFSIICFIQSVLKINAPYGRYAPINGVGVHPRLAWFLQESPSLILPLVYFGSAFAINSHKFYNYYISVPLLMFILHYVHRCLIYPFVIITNNRTPVWIVLSAFIVCSLNGYMQGYYLCYVNDATHMYEYSFPIGCLIYSVGMILNISSEAHLRSLRRQSNAGTYALPTQGLFTLVTCPHYLGEWIEWFGYVIACHFSLPSMTFLFLTIANTLPRALAHHQWYQDKFKDQFPKHKKAVIPFLL